jgi:hypothetical protein
MKDVLKAAGLGLAVGAGVVGGMYIGGKLVGVGCSAASGVKGWFKSDKAAAPAAPAAAAQS